MSCRQESTPYKSALEQNVSIYMLRWQQLLREDEHLIADTPKDTSSPAVFVCSMKMMAAVVAEHPETSRR